MPQFTRYEGGGHYRTGEEANFPWSSTDRSVWYSFLVVEDGKIVRYGFTSAKGSKTDLLECLQATKGQERTLLGVWTGQYSTHRFVLDPDKAIKVLARL